MSALDPSAFDQLFLEARTHSTWLQRDVSDETLRRLYDVMRMAPTSANTNPGRFVFVKSPAAKEKLRPALNPANVDKTMAAPVTAIIAYDTTFHEHLPKLFPGRDMKSAFAALPEEKRLKMGEISATLQAAYLILAARAMGLDCGPMAGFDGAKVDAAFFVGTTWRSILLVNLGYGDTTKVYPRNPRLEFDEVARIE